MMEAARIISAKVLEFQWGVVQVEGYDAPFKDVKIYPGGARAWDWGETGTRHEPGVQIGDVVELVENGAEVVVLTRGVNERLQVQESTLRWLEEQGVEVHVLQTEAAIEKYNQLTSSEQVGILIHSTC